MVKLYKFFFAFLSLFCLFVSIPAYAQQPLPRESGFSGYLEIMGAHISTNSQLNTDNKIKQIDFYESTGFLTALGVGYMF